MRESMAADRAFGIMGAIENSVAKLSNTVLSSIGFTIEVAKCALSTGLRAEKTKIWGTTTISCTSALYPSSDDSSYMTAPGPACCLVRGPILTDPQPYSHTERADRTLVTNVVCREADASSRDFRHHVTLV